MNGCILDGLPDRLRALAEDEIKGVSAVLSPANSMDLLAAADEIARLRNQVEQLQSEVVDAKKWAMQERSQRWALPDPPTDAERVSVKWAAQMIDDSGEYKWHADTLRGLLERLG
jgi:hypothetical protein